MSKAYSLHADLNDERIQKSLNMLIVRLVFLLYADDTGILGSNDIFQHFLERREAQDIRQGLIELFRVLNTPEDDRDEFLSEEFKQFKYVNGGMFSDESVVIPQFTDELQRLIVEDAGRGFNWSSISPTIFGAVFESTLNPETRREGGMHYTSVENIHKVIDPLFLNDLNKEFEKIRDISVVSDRVEKARQFQEKLSNIIDNNIVIVTIKGDNNKTIITVKYVERASFAWLNVVIITVLTLTCTLIVTLDSL